MGGNDGICLLSRFRADVEESKMITFSVSEIRHPALNWKEHEVHVEVKFGVNRIEALQYRPSTCKGTSVGFDRAHRCLFVDQSVIS